MKDFLEEYISRTQKSKLLYEEAIQHLPGGVTTPIRSFIKPHPFFVDRGDGSRLWDVDGNEYIDYNNCYGAIIAGHANPIIKKAVQEQLDKGLLFGVPHEKDTLLVKELKRRYPMMEMFRFTNSGAETTMYAIKVARAYTGKDKIIKMEGAYHGSHDYLLISHHPPVGRMGPAWSPTPHVLSEGVPKDVSKNTIIAPFNDAEHLEHILKRDEGEIAAVIIEPVLGNCGVIIPEEGYLNEVRALTKKHNVVLMFDEVKVGLRVAAGGAAEYFGINPDIVCLAKVLGGGMQLGAFGVNKDISVEIAPLGGAMHFGTYNGHPGSVAAGLAVLTQVLTDEAYDQLNSLSDRLRKGMKEILERLGISGLVQGVGSMSSILFTELEKVTNYREAIKSDQEFFMRYYMGCLTKGVFLMGPLWSEESVLTTAHTEGDIDQTLNVINDTLKELKS